MFKKSLLVFMLMATFMSTSLLSTNAVQAASPSVLAPGYIETGKFVTYPKTEYAHESKTPFTIWHEENRHSRLYGGYLKRTACYDQGAYIGCRYEGKIYRR
ncbi:hypothetical protein IC620_16370 [Hazenella sp. IB182357]|uniref:Uncharacterized protein n=1 Tax=Polycladospora coralii TaxID=2771432 RepID=A0A926RUG8_9BACL|nr:hypothetical protein [Polycladospora coralii]MBD1373920.1 hypothetical protein [Polycladospora coralii]MBS7531042.1 hypothetical protein [Polycladospora coralii]